MKINVMTLTNGELKKIEIENNLSSLQNLVGGYIEIPCLSERLTAQKIITIINEKGKFLDLTPEIACVYDGKLHDIVFGTVIFASTDYEGNTLGLNTEQMEYIKNELRNDAIVHLRNRNKTYMLKVLQFE